MSFLHSTERNGVANRVFCECRTEEHEKSCGDRDPGNALVERRRRRGRDGLEPGGGMFSRSMSGRVRHRTER